MMGLMLSDKDCSVVDCDNTATVVDEMDNILCDDCMDMEIMEGADPDTFETVENWASSQEIPLAVQ